MFDEFASFFCATDSRRRVHDICSWVVSGRLRQMTDATDAYTHPTKNVPGIRGLSFVRSCRCLQVSCSVWGCFSLLLVARILTNFDQNAEPQRLDVDPG